MRLPVLALILLALILAGAWLLSWETTLSMAASSSLKVPGTAYPAAVEGERALSLVLPEKVGPATFETGNLSIRVECKTRVEAGSYGYGASIMIIDPQVLVKIKHNGKHLTTKNIKGQGRVEAQLRAPGTVEVYLVGVGDDAACTVEAATRAVYSVRAALNR